MNLNDFAKEVHALAIEKGFYDPAPSDVELIAAIHSEISEAFEEWRAGRGMKYKSCRMDPIFNDDNKRNAEEYIRENSKPAGIAAELIDVVLRILDTAAAWEFDVPSIEAFDLRFVFVNSYRTPTEDVDLPSLVAELHCDVSRAWEEISNDEREDGMDWLLMTALPNIFAWLRAQNIDPEALMLEKHEYNQTRPYKHGGKRI